MRRERSATQSAHGMASPGAVVAALDDPLRLDRRMAAEARVALIDDHRRAALGGLPGRFGAPTDARWRLDRILEEARALSPKAPTSQEGSR